MTPSIRALKLLIGVVAVALVAAGCTSDTEKNQTPAWQTSPPEYLSCGGLIKPQLVVDLMVAADLGNPHREETESNIQRGKPRSECSINRTYTISFLVNQPELQQIAGSFAPPDTTSIPIPQLLGMVRADYSYLYAPCTTQSGRVTLEASMKIHPPGYRVPDGTYDTVEVRLAMARLLANAMNGSREKFGCSEKPLPLPTSLPDIPHMGKPRGEDARPNGRECYIGNLPNDSVAYGEDSWTVGSPEPSRLMTFCEIRSGRGEGFPVASFVTYKGPLARAYQNSKKFAQPRYDITCHGKPISYRLYAEKDGHYSRDLPPGYKKALERNAADAARAAGCPLPS